jgi:hypothetical protein
MYVPTATNHCIFSVNFQSIAFTWRNFYSQDLQSRYCPLTIVPVSLHRPRKTLPNEPWPMSSRMSYLSMVMPRLHKKMPWPQIYIHTYWRWSWILNVIQTSDLKIANSVLTTTGCWTIHLNVTICSCTYVGSQDFLKSSSKLFLWPNKFKLDFVT